MDLVRLHPQARVALGVQPRVPLTAANIADVRRSMIDAAPVEVGSGPAVDLVEDVDADGVSIRVYQPGRDPNVTSDPRRAPADGPPADDHPVPVMIHAHGGGWALGDLDTHDGFCRQLAVGTGWAVIAVDYRLAPEHPYPAAVDDVHQVLTWLRRSGAAAYGLDPERIALVGDSSGGLLAAVTARRARDAGVPIVAQILLCPALDPEQVYPELDDYGLHRDEMRFFWDSFAPDGVDRHHHDIAPLRVADLAGLAPALVITAELDVLRDEGERYAARLTAAGVPVIATRYQGLIHNFQRKLALFDAAQVVLAQIGAVLGRP